VPYRIDLHGAGGAALDRLVELGALDIEMDGTDLAVLMPDGVAPDEVARLLAIADFTVSAAAGRDDGSVWTLTLPPLRVGSAALSLVDAPAFGTGLHPTTALCLEMIEDLAGADPPARMLDVGTGSGVLAIAALVLGVGRVTAIDIDTAALDAAAANAVANGVADRLDLRHGGPEQMTGTWTLVVANVLAAPLIAMAPQLVRRVSHYGRLAVSGIPQSAEHDVVAAYRHLGMRHLETRARRGWIAAQLQASW